VASRAELRTPLAQRRIERGDPEYPARLLALGDPPERVLVAGAWPPANPSVAIVGARAATPYGREFARRLSFDLARLSHPVVSGLARGIDAAAHEGALEAGGVTLAVLPGSLDEIVPPQHQALARRIMVQGALISEREAGFPVQRRSFIERNRLIAALASAVVVVEAAEGSGALHTAEFARRLRRPLLAVPGDVDRPTSRGCHALLRAGARLCEDAADVLAALGEDAPRAVRGRRASIQAPAPVATGASPQQRVLAALTVRATTVESCASAAGLDVASTLNELIQLEWAGLATREPGARWRRGGRA